MASRTGIDARSQIATGQRNIADELADMRQSVPSRQFIRGVVVEVINDLSVYNDEKIAELKKNVSNPNDLDDMPRNSCLVRVITDSAAIGNNTSKLCYPFYPPYLAMPIKPGEYVWLFNESPDDISDLLYWMHRVPESGTVDDVNYTHGDRRYTSQKAQSTFEKSKKEDEDKRPGFPNGPEGPDARTLDPSDDFDAIVGRSESYKQTAKEVVPRYTKRPGDFIVQGSNNALIVLGDSRESYSPRPDLKRSTATKEESLKDNGTIDIVVGRGRFTSKDELPTRSEANVIENESEERQTWEEVDKDPESSRGASENNTENPTEGDPDFRHDASRVFTSMDTDIDVHLEIGKGSQNYVTLITGELVDKKAAAAFMKSDEVRIIARKNKDKNINGSVRIIKEGDPNNDLCAIYLLDDGTVHITGKQIYMGRSNTNGGKLDGPGPGGSQPYVKYKQLEDLLTATFDNISSFADSLSKNFAANSTPGFGGPNPALIKAAAVECTKLKADMVLRAEEIKKIKSDILFGG
jgi:hypothetical protein